MENSVVCATLRRCLIIFWLGLFHVQCVAAAEPYIRVSLKNEISFLMPRNWTVLTDSTRATIDAHLGAKQIRVPDSDLNFAANLYDEQRTTLALLNVRYYPDQVLTQSDVHKFSAADLVEISGYLREGMVKAGSISGFSILNWYGVSKVPINRTQALVVQYRRSAMPQATDRLPHRVRLVRVLDGARSFTLTISYRDDQALLLGPICDAITDSLRTRFSVMSK